MTSGIGTRSILPLSSFCLTTKESNSGNHLGHNGHAVENVLSRINRNEKTTDPDVLIVPDLFVDSPSSSLSEPTAPSSQL